MAALRDDLTQQHAQRALMSAMRVSDKCLALRRVAISIHQIFERAKAELPLPNLLAWAAIAAGLLKRVSEVLRSVDEKHSKLRSALSTSVTETSFTDPYQLFVYRARAEFPVARQPARLDLLLIVLLCTAAGAEASLSDDVASGMRQAFKAIENDSRNHWREIADKAPLNVTEVDVLLGTVKAEVVKDFLRQVRTYLSTPITAPKPGLASEPTTAVQQTDAAATGNSERQNSAGKPAKRSDEKAPAKPGDEEKRETLAPTIAAAVYEAQLSPIGAKAGVCPLWDLLIPEELAAITRELHADLVSDDLKRSVISVLALVALLVSCNPKAARLLPTCGFAPSGQVEIWINVERGWICWWQHAYINASADGPNLTSGGKEGQIFNIIPMPEALATRVRELYAAAGTPDELRASLDHALGPSGLLMADVNARLKELGDKAHLAEPTRFATSLGPVVLEVTRSDMAAGHLMRFAVCPSSAPFYFSPRTEWLSDVFARLYERLGLGRPVSMEGAPARQGTGVGHETSKLQAGFAELISDVVHMSDAVQAWASDHEGIEAIAQLAPRCAELFHISIGGRGSEPERIVLASVLAGRNFFALMDKMTDGDKSSRVLPHTAVTSAVVRVFCAAKARAEQRLGMRTARKSASEHPLFATIERHPDGTGGTSTNYAWKAIEAAAISAMAKHYFSAGLNFQRGLIVTEMGEAFVNRWLIRAMTGHGSYLTRAFAPSMGVSPAEALELMREELEIAQQATFGSAERLLKYANQLPEISTPSLPIGPPRESHSIAYAAPISGDPLQPLDTQCLIDWRLVEDMRQYLAAADGSMATDVELLHSALAFSGLPTVELALDLVLDASALKRVGSIPGIVWKRPHYVYDLWLPLQRPTRLALQHRGSSAILSRQALITQAAQVLRSRPGYHGWPSDDYKALARFKQAFESWRRIEFPPYLCAVALPWQESACLSHRSLWRLAEDGATAPLDLNILSPQFKRGDRASNRVHGLKRIGSALQEAATDVASKGRLILRGQVLNNELDKLSPHGTAVYHFLVRVYRREAHEMVKDLQTANDASSTYTRFSALWPTFEALRWDADPDQFTDTTWVQIVEDVNKHCLSAMIREDKQYMTTDGAKRSSRAQDALQRLFHVLSRDGYEIPDSAWQAIGGAVVRQPRISASSTVIFDSDTLGICESVKTILTDEPLLVQRITTKARTMAKAPLRIGEASCVPFDCVTQSGALALPTTPFDIDKSSHAPRLIPLEEELAQLNRSLGEVSRAISPLGKWMYRFDDDAIQDDVRGNRLLAELIRLQTGDAFARPHSLRANAYQQLLWPGWRRMVTQFLRAETTAQTCRVWDRADDLERRWTRAINSAVAAGHGAVDPGLLHYASAWPLIYALHYEGALSRTPPGEGWLRRFNVRPESMERARRRAGRDDFDAWRWLESGRADVSSVAPLYELPGPDVAHPAIDHTAGAPSSERQLIIHSSGAILYLVLRALGLTTHSAAHESGISGRVQEVIEPHRLGDAVVAEARRRVKPHKPKEAPKAGNSSKGARRLKLGRFGQLDVSQNADVDLILEEEGETMRPIIQWALALSDADAATLDALFRRDAKVIDSPESVRARSIWERVTRGMPSLIRLRLRFGIGSQFLTGAEETVLARDGDSWFLASRHPDRGQLPDVTVSRTDQSNPVMDCRVTSVIRLVFASRLALNHAEAHYLKRTNGTSLIHLPPEGRR